MHTRTRKIVISALIAALICVVTMTLKIPSPLFKGYLNLGDGIVLAAGWMLPPAFGFLAAGLGSALADLFSGYIVYAPATFAIKGLMALIASYAYKLLRKKTGGLSARILSGAASEIEMTLGYFVFEGFMYGFAPSLVNIPMNGVQGLAGLGMGVILMKMLVKGKIVSE